MPGVFNDFIPEGKDEGAMGAGFNDFKKSQVPQPKPEEAKTEELKEEVKGV